MAERLPEGARHCRKCGMVKPLRAFYPRGDRPGDFYSTCRACKVATNAIYRATPRGVAWWFDYVRRPEVVERRREAEQRRAEAKRAQKREYEQTPRARIVRARRDALRRSGRAEDRSERARWRRRAEECEREIRRMDRDLDCERKRGPRPTRA